MAETYLAVQRGVAGFEPRVCVKFILPQHRDDAGFKQLFLREASTAASLRHSNIVGVIDVDQRSDYFWLPAAKKAPAWAWGVGVAGLAVSGVGLGLALAGTDCNIADPHVACQTFTADASFGPLLMMHGLPLLAVPLTYVVRGATRSSYAKAVVAELRRRGFDLLAEPALVSAVSSAEGPPLHPFGHAGAASGCGCHVASGHPPGTTSLLPALLLAALLMRCARRRLTLRS
jgi:MYXO-CTERM domain-containing protein